MDIVAKIGEVVKRIQDDPNLAQEFKADPGKTLENILGVDLPDEMIDTVIKGVQNQLGAAGAGLNKVIGQVEEKVAAEGGLGGILGKVEGLFGKKDGTDKPAE